VTVLAHVLLIPIGGVAALVLLVYIGIALPAVWSGKPARREAAAAVLRQILNACTGGEHRRMPTQAAARRIRGQTTHAKPGSQSLLLVRTQRLAVDNRTHNLSVEAGDERHRNG
jgi:hypothetical protein